MIKRLYDSIRIFDKQHYLRLYPDIEESRFSPLVHAIRFGIRENRSISPWINPDWYLERYPESSASGLSVTEHFFLHGSDSGFSPGPDFNTNDYLELYPDVATSKINPLIHFVKYGFEEGRLPRRLSKTQLSAERRTVASAGETVENLVRTRWLSNEPLRLMHDSGEQPRVHLVTDSFSPDSLFGGVATSIIIAAQLANKLNFGLCLVTRDNPAVNLGAVTSLLRHYGIKLNGRIDHEHLFPDSSKVLATNDRDVFVGTSWWTTAALLNSVIDTKKIVYILQEDEREFYPSGDERLRASQTMDNDQINVIVNTSMLRKYLIKSGLDSLKRTSMDFEPAFDVYSKKERNNKQKNSKKRLFFYARPNNFRNLFFLGIEAIDHALLNGNIDSEKWDIVLVGKDLPEISFSNGVAPLIAGNLSHESYADFLQTFDAGISLMATPHPSYPPLDLAASGVPVLTNSWPGKPDLSEYSPLIHVAKPEIEQLSEAIGKILKLKIEKSNKQHLIEPFCNSWSENLEQLIAKMSTKISQ